MDRVVCVDRSVLIEGEFGAIAPWACARCGPIWDEPHDYCSFRGTYSQPPEYTVRCPRCCGEEVGTNDAPRLSYLVKRRYYASL